jgi:UDP-N-acetylglucosamine acyltransferase
MIHKKAIISPNAKIGKNVKIGPYSIIGDDVIIGDGTEISSHAVIDPYVEIGKNCKIYQFASIGTVPQDLKFKGEKSFVKIGNNTTIREFATIHRGTELGTGITEIGNDNFIMAYTHIAHDSKTGNHVILSNNATLAGHITIGDHAVIGGLVAIHQFVSIGSHAFIGGKSAVVKDVPPYTIAVGDRAKLHGLNTVGLQRRGFSEETKAELKKAYRLIFRLGLGLNEAIERIKAEVKQIPEIINFVDFIKSSERGITR